MYASDVTNALASSPGTITNTYNTTGTSTYSYTATTNVELFIVGNISTNGSIQLNSVPFYSFSGTGNDNFTRNIYVAKSQTVVFSLTNNVGISISARSIQ